MTTTGFLGYYFFLETNQDNRLSNDPLCLPKEIITRDVRLSMTEKPTYPHQGTLNSLERKVDYAVIGRFYHISFLYG